MKSGSPEIQKTMERQVPRDRNSGELKKQWFVRVARFYGCTYGQAENFYYREGYDIPNEIFLKLSSLRISGHPANKLQRPNRLEDIRLNTEEIDQIIKERTDVITQAALRSFAEAILGALPRSAG